MGLSAPVWGTIAVEQEFRFCAMRTFSIMDNNYTKNAHIVQVNYL